MKESTSQSLQQAKGVLDLYEQSSCMVGEAAYYFIVTVKSDNV